MTRLLPDVVLGSQTPRVANVPPAVTSAGAEAVELAELAGLDLDPWQRWVLEQALGQRADGRWAAFEVGLVVPRQNGKGGVLEALELAALFLHGVPIMHTAHLMQTSKDAFKRIWSLIAETPDLCKRVRKVRTANEEHSIEVRSGALLKFMARSGRSGRGLADGDLIILDEALFLDPEQMAALVPTASTKPNPQIWYTSSAGKAESEQLRGLRARGEQRDPGLAFMEWSVTAPEPGQVLDVTDEQLWAQANPALGIRISPEYVRSELRILGPELFARERLGVFDEPGTAQRVIGAQVWAARLDVASAPVGPVVFGLDANPERTAAAIGVAGRREDGDAHVEVVATFAGLDGVVERAVELDDAHGPTRWVIDPNGPAGALVVTLADAGLDVVTVTGPDLARACTGFYDDLPWHLGDPVLDAAVAGARKREIGDGAWAFGRKSSGVNIAPLIAVVLARNGLGGAEAFMPPLAVESSPATRSETADLARMGF